jgi:hypothetical protein
MQRLNTVIATLAVVVVVVALAGASLPVRADPESRPVDSREVQHSDPSKTGPAANGDSSSGTSAWARDGALQANCAGHTGTLTLLRVHDVGTGYGSGGDFLDVEVIVRFNTEPDNAYGFQLREDANSLVRQGMLDLLRDAFDNNWTVTVNECDDVIFRVWLTK